MAKARVCTQCGSCINTCPVYALKRREEMTPKAKQELLAFVARRDGELPARGPAPDEGVGLRALLGLASHCVCCERCHAVCPRGLSVPEVLNAARHRHPVWQQEAWKRWIGAGDALWPVAKAVAPLFPASLLPARLAPLLAQAGAMAEAPARAPWLELESDAPEILGGRDVVLFGGCTATRLRPSWMAKARRAVTRLGGHVLDGRGFGCCGGTFGHAGLPEAAARAAAANVAAWRKLGRPTVVTICASCLHGLRGYGQHSSPFTDAAEAALWGERLVPLSVPLAKAAVRATAAVPAAPRYHSPCHWGNRDDDFAWLSRSLPGLARGKALCCGFGGIVQILDPGLSRELAGRCWEGLTEASASGERTGNGPAPVLEAVTGCSGCALQLRANAPAGARAAHWLDILGV